MIDLTHVLYMLNSEPMHAEILLDSEGLKPSSRIGLDTEILLELFDGKLRGPKFGTYLNNLNL